jgi:hypothetical protein
MAHFTSLLRRVNKEIILFRTVSKLPGGNCRTRLNETSPLGIQKAKLRNLAFKKVPLLGI